MPEMPIQGNIYEGSPVNPEQERETKVILEFFRHSKKENDPAKTDEEIRLTEAGRVLATERGKALSPQPEVSLAYGSPKERTQETAARIMLADRIDADASLEDIGAMIAEQVKYGTKIIEDPRLGFDTAGPVGKEMMEAFGKGEYLRYLYEESDNRIRRYGDRVTSSYSRFAGNIAEIILKHLEVAKNFHRIAQDGTYGKHGDALERYFGTHQGVLESFLAKAITYANTFDGGMRASKFMMSSGNGFSETQGIRVEIRQSGGEQEIVVFHSMNEESEEFVLTPQILREFVAARDDWDRIADFVADVREVYGGGDQEIDEILEFADSAFVYCSLELHVPEYRPDEITETSSLYPLMKEYLTDMDIPSDGFDSRAIVGDGIKYPGLIRMMDMLGFRPGSIPDIIRFAATHEDEVGSGIRCLGGESDQRELVLRRSSDDGYFLDESLNQGVLLNDSGAVLFVRK